MDRRDFLAAMATGPALAALQPRPVPKYRIVTNHKPAASRGMPGPYPGRVVTVQSAKFIDEVTEKVDVPTVQTMIARGMSTLTGDKDARDSWARFFNAQDFVGIKVNASGAPGAMSMPEVVAEITRNLTTVGVKPTNIVIHERGGGQILNPNTTSSCLPACASSRPTPGSATTRTSMSKWTSSAKKTRARI